MHNQQQFKRMNTGRQHEGLNVPVATQRSLSRRTSSLPCIAFYAGLLIFLSLTTLVSSQDVRVGNFITDDTFTECQVAAAEADADMDMKLSSDEYVAFVNIFSGDELEETVFAEMPLRFVLIYNWVACFCSYEPGSSTQCCVGDNAHIALDNSTDSLQILMLFCEQTDATINAIVGAGTAMPSLSLFPSAAPSPSAVPSYTPSAALTFNPSNAPIQGISAVPSFAPSGVASFIPSFSPSIPTIQPTVEGLLCLNFQYTLRNEANLTASDIFNEVNNTLKSRLIIATGITVTDILNETYPMALRTIAAGGDLDSVALRTSAAGGDLDSVGGSKGGGSKRSGGKNRKGSDMPDLSQVLSVQQTSSESGGETEAPLLPLNRRLHSSPRFVSVVENAALTSLGGDQIASDLVRAELEEWKVAQDHVRRSHDVPARRSDLRRSRRLVFYTDDIPATIVLIADAPLFLCPGGIKTSSSRCVIISSTVCVVLGPKDDEKEVRATLVQGLEEAINSGEFEDNIPPEERRS